MIDDNMNKSVNVFTFRIDKQLAIVKYLFNKVEKNENKK